jgi:hypothetical protein
MNKKVYHLCLWQGQAFAFSVEKKWKAIFNHFNGYVECERLLWKMYIFWL